MQTVEDGGIMQAYCLTRDAALRNRLAEEYLYIADIVARRYQGRGADYDDLLQVASLALIRALDRFDCTRGAQFSTFATPALIGAVKNYLRDRADVVRLPRSDAQTAAKLRAASEELTQRIGRVPRPAELAAHAGLSVERTVETLALWGVRRPVSLDAPPSDDGCDFQAILGQADPGYGRVEFDDWYAREVSRMTGLERAVIQGRFTHELSQREIASRLGVSQMAVSRTERRLLDRFRKSLADAPPR